MEWRDEGIVLGTRRHGETSVIVEAMTAVHGRHLGMVRGGRSKRMQPVLQPGNRVELTWRARLDEHLGTYQVEPLELNAARLLGGSRPTVVAWLQAGRIPLVRRGTPRKIRRPAHDTRLEASRATALSPGRWRLAGHAGASPFWQARPNQPRREPPTGSLPKDALH
jgi:excisionase family DNA binding protein